MAIKDDDLLYVQRPTGDDAGSYKIEARDLLSGSNNATVTTVSQSSPLSPKQGDLWWADTSIDDGGGRLYVFTGSEWVDISLPGNGEDGILDSYLSRLNDDTAEGLITFDSGILSDSLTSIGDSLRILSTAATQVRTKSGLGSATNDENVTFEVAVPVNTGGGTRQVIQFGSRRITDGTTGGEAEIWMGTGNGRLAFNVGNSGDTRFYGRDSIEAYRVKRDTGDVIFAQPIGGDLTGNAGSADKVQGTSFGGNNNRPISCWNTRVDTGGVSPVYESQAWADTNSPTINGGTGSITASGGFVGNLTGDVTGGLTGTATNADKVKYPASGFGTSSSRRIACFGSSSSNPTPDSHLALAYASENAPVISGSGEIKCKGIIGNVDNTDLVITGPVGTQFTTKTGLPQTAGEVRNVAEFKVPVNSGGGTTQSIFIGSKRLSDGNGGNQSHGFIQGGTGKLAFNHGSSGTTRFFGIDTSTGSEVDSLAYTISRDGSMKVENLSTTGNFGIGKVNPNANFEVANTSGNVVSRFTAKNDSDVYLQFADPDDTNVGEIRYSHADDSMRFRANDVERMRINKDGKVGIGTSDPQAPLHTVGSHRLDKKTTINGNYGLLYLNANSTTDYGLSIRHYQGNTDLSDAGIYVGGSTNEAKGCLRFLTSPDSGASAPLATRMEIKKDGAVSVNGTFTAGSVNSNGSGQFAGKQKFVRSTSNTSQYIDIDCRNNSNNYIVGNGNDKDLILVNESPGENIEFQTRFSSSQSPSRRFFVGHNGNVVVDSLKGTGNRNVMAQAGGTLVIESSDERLKENIEDLGVASDLIKALRPVSYNWIQDTPNNERGLEREIGFIAQEVQKVIPEVVGTTFAPADVGGEDYLSLSYTHLVPVLTKALQEVMQKNTDLEARIAALEGASSGGL